MMKLNNLWILTLISFGLFFSSCSKDKSEKPTSTEAVSSSRFLWTEKPKAGDSQIKVLNQFGTPIGGAKILIGEGIDSPFKNNFLTTNELGIATPPPDWRTPASVTVDARGFIRQTLLNISPGILTLKLNTSYLPQYAEIHGDVSQLPVVNGDKLVDFALVLPALSKSDLFDLNVDQIISPYNDILTTAGRKNPIFSNISLPKQKETYIIGVTLNKPIYRVKVPTLGSKKILAARGRFVFDTVASELKNGKQFYELINDFSFLGGGFREATVLGEITNLDIPGNEIAFNTSITVKPTRTHADELLLLLATSEISNSMITTDIKRQMNNQPMNLQSIKGKPTTIISVLKRQSEFMSQTPGSDRMSASFLTYTPTDYSQKLLPLISNPSITQSTHYTINLPSLPITEGINPIAMTASISDLYESVDNDKTIIQTIRKWDVLGLGWNQEINLPNWPLEKSNSRKRIEVNFIGSNKNKKIKLDDSLTTNTTHITHASADF